MDYLEKGQLIDIDTTDVFVKMNEYLKQYGYYELTDRSAKLELSLSCLKNYLLEKLNPYQLVELANDPSILEIMKIISERLPKYCDSKKIDPIIHYLINLFSLYVEYYIIWEINVNREDNENYLEFKNGKIDKLITGQNIDYYKTFGILYSYLVGESTVEPDQKKLEIK